MKRPLSVWLLLAYFASCVVGGTAALITHEHRPDYKLFAAAGLENLFLAMTAAIVALSAATVHFIWNPRETAIRVGIATIAALVAAELVASIVAWQNIDAFRPIVAAELAARGQEADTLDAAVELATSLTAFVVGVAFTGFAAALGAWLFVRNRRYFVGT